MPGRQALCHLPRHADVVREWQDRPARLSLVIPRLCQHHAALQGWTGRWQGVAVARAGSDTQAAAPCGFRVAPKSPYKVQDGVLQRNKPCCLSPALTSENTACRPLPPPFDANDAAIRRLPSRARVWVLYRGAAASLHAQGASSGSCKACALPASLHRSRSHCHARLLTTTRRPVKGGGCSRACCMIRTCRASNVKPMRAPGNIRQSVSGVLWHVAEMSRPVCPMLVCGG